MGHRRRRRRDAARPLAGPPWRRRVAQPCRDVAGARQGLRRRTGGRPRRGGAPPDRRRAGRRLDGPSGFGQSGRPLRSRAPSPARDRRRGCGLRRRRQAGGDDCRAAAGARRGGGHAARSAPASLPARTARVAARGAPDRPRHQRAGALRPHRRRARRAQGAVRAPHARARLPGGARRHRQAGERHVERSAGVGRGAPAPASGARHRRARQGGGGRLHRRGAVRSGGAREGLARHRQAQPDPGAGRGAGPSARSASGSTVSARPRRRRGCRPWTGRRSTRGASGSAIRRPAGP